jgi:hypothetical protein
MEGVRRVGEKVPFKGLRIWRKENLYKMVLKIRKKYEHYGQHEKMLTIGEHRWASLTRNLTS